jgi:fibronectin type 3 domain-containing protein
VVDRLWYLTRPTARAAFVCSTSGNWSSHGCGTGNYWKVFRAADDDDGNLDNGTPHSCYLYAAFNRHMVACTTDTAADVCHSGCTPPPSPTLTASPGNNEVQLSWTPSGAGVVYDVYRNEAGCEAGFTKIAEDVSGLEYTDTAVANGYTYYYQVTVQPTGNEACSSPPSNCESAEPIPCTPPAAPGNPAAVTNGDNRIDVSWEAVGTAFEYHVYRAGVTGGPYSLIATVNASNLLYSDATVSGGSTYYYVVTAEDDCTESAYSDEASATATGECLLPPTFGGVETVSNPALSACTLDLGWSAATLNCPGGGLAYNVHRSTTPGFNPTPFNRIAYRVVGTTYRDDRDLDSGTTYYYIVRAVDTGTGAQDLNTVEASGVPTGPVTIGTWSDDAGDTGSAQLDLDSPWSVATSGGHNGPKVYRTGTYGAYLCVAVTTPTLHLGTDPVLTFWSKYDIEDDWDKGEVQISIDGGSSWERVPVNYPGYASNTGYDACDLPAAAFFSGIDLTYAEYTASLSTWSNQDAQIRWVLSSDGYVDGTGWWVDDIAITNVEVFGDCTTQTETPMFADGFESGDTSEWSRAVP